MSDSRTASKRNQTPPLRQVRIAYAHSGTDSYAYVVFEGGQVSGNVQYPIHELSHAMGIELSTDPAKVDKDVTSHFDAIAGYASQHFHVGDAEGTWQLRFTGHRTLSRSIGSYAILEYEVDRSQGTVQGQLEVSFDGIIESNPHHHALVLVISTHGWGALKTKAEQRLEFGAGSPSQDIRLKTDNWLADLTGTLTFVGDNFKEYWRRARKRLASPPS